MLNQSSSKKPLRNPILTSFTTRDTPRTYLNCNLYEPPLEYSALFGANMNKPYILCLSFNVCYFIFNPRREKSKRARAQIAIIISNPVGRSRKCLRFTNICIYFDAYTHLYFICCFGNPAGGCGYKVVAYNTYMMV